MYENQTNEPKPPVKEGVLLDKEGHEIGATSESFSRHNVKVINLGFLGPILLLLLLVGLAIAMFFFTSVFFLVLPFSLIFSKRARGFFQRNRS